MILYLHGFNSSAASGKAVATLQQCERCGIDIKAPDLPHQPAEAIALAMRLCQGENILAVGSSLGGYYATWLVENGYAQFAVLVNPAVAVADKLKSQIGVQQQNYNSDERYLYTKVHDQELRELEIRNITRPECYLLLVQEGDEVLDYREATGFYSGAKQIIEPEGDHSFVNYERHLELILGLARKIDLS